MYIVNILLWTYLDRSVSVTCYTAHLPHTNITLKYRLCVGQRTLHIETTADEWKGVLEQKKTQIFPNRDFQIFHPHPHPTPPSLFNESDQTGGRLSTRTFPEATNNGQMYHCH